MTQTPGTPASAKPPLVMTAAILLIVVGALNLLAALAYFQVSTTLGSIVGVLSLVIGAAGIYAGIQVLNLREQGRTLGIGVAAVGAAFGIYAIIQGVFLPIIGLAINVFIIYALTQTKTSFSR
jgi:hypothetical protein